MILITMSMNMFQVILTMKIVLKIIQARVYSIQRKHLINIELHILLIIYHKVTHLSILSISIAKYIHIKIHFKEMQNLLINLNLYRVSIVRKEQRHQQS